MSSAAKFFAKDGAMASAVTRFATNKGLKMSMKGMAAGYMGKATRSGLYAKGAQAAAFVAKHPRGSVGGAAAGIGAMGYGAMRHRGSQNYPMY